MSNDYFGVQFITKNKLMFGFINNCNLSPANASIFDDRCIRVGYRAI